MVGLLFWHSLVSIRFTLLIVPEDEVERFQRWLNASDQSTSYQTALKAWDKDTGNWFLESDVFRDWQTTPTSTMWLHGIPGCGKTVLSAVIIDHLLQKCNDNGKKPALYFHFDFEDPRKKTAADLVGSMISQLLLISGCPNESLRKIYSTCLNGQHQPSLEELLHVLKDLLGHHSSTFIVIDALDESTERESLLELLGVIAHWRLEQLHLMVTSRSDKVLWDGLSTLVGNQNVIGFAPNDVGKDIFRYIRGRLSSHPQLKKWTRDPVLWAEIEARLVNKAAGMYVRSNRYFTDQSNLPLCC